MIRAMGPVLLQAHGWVWLTGSVKAPQNNSSQRVGVGERCPAMAHCGHLQRQHWWGSGRDAKGSLWDQGRDQDQDREKRQDRMSTSGDQREEATEGVLLSFWARKGPRARLCPFKHCLGWQQQLAQLGPRSLLRERVFHFQITTPSVLLSVGVQWYGPLDAAGIKARVQKISGKIHLGGLWCPWRGVQVQARAGSSKLSS